LRLIPFGALHDGMHYAIEKYAISMITGLSMTNMTASAGREMEALVVGVSEPGPVVEKLSQLMASHILQPEASTTESKARGLAYTRQMREIRALETAGPVSANAMRHGIENLRAQLALPGVKEEVDALGDILPGAHLLDANFTVSRFSVEAESGAYRIVHIASHGVFAGSAETSFIMAYDDLLTMNDLQSLLKAEKFQRTPIELLSLSACETAEGNDRAPLGIAGAAIKARAKSVLGTLWPVEDEAAQSVMKTLYTGLVSGSLSKTEALRKAQIQLIRNPDTAHPFYWAPFVLIGNWM
jgi:CHAT domain-containing protein